MSETIRLIVELSYQRFEVKDAIPKIMCLMKGKAYEIVEGDNPTNKAKTQEDSKQKGTDVRLDDIQNEALNGLVDIYLQNKLPIKEMERNTLELVKICKEWDEICIQKFLYQIIIQGIVSEEIIDHFWDSFLLELDNNFLEWGDLIKILRVWSNYRDY